MSASPGEPEKYSLNEMLERLNQASSPKQESGELVTRADGTQAIRVRKRKRRSRQPHKDQAAKTRKLRIIQVSVLLVLLLLLGLAAGGLFVYSNSAPFRKGLAEKIADSSGASTELMQFRVTPGGANANQLIFRWPEGNLLEHLQLSRLSADIHPSSYLGKTWAGDEAHAQQGTLKLRLPVAGQPLRASSSASKVFFSRLSVSELDVSLGNAGSTPLLLAGTEASLYIKNAQGLPELRLNGGKLKIPHWPTFHLDRAFIEFSGQNAQISAIRLRSEDDERGILELSGPVQPYAAGDRSKLDARLDAFMIQELAGPLSGLVAGRIESRHGSGPNSFSFLPGENPDASLEIAFASSVTSTIGISQLPFLASLARSFDDQSFARLTFDTKAIGTLQRKGNFIRLGDLDFESRGKIALKGEIIADANEKLRGTLEVGIAAPIITSSTASRLDQIFGPVRDGFRWITLELSGTADDPRDDFGDIYAGTISGSRRSSSESSSPGPTEPVPTLDSNEMWDELTKPR